MEISAGRLILNSISTVATLAALLAGGPSKADGYDLCIKALDESVLSPVNVVTKKSCRVEPPGCLFIDPFCCVPHCLDLPQCVVTRQISEAIDFVSRGGNVVCFKEDAARYVYENWKAGAAELLLNSATGGVSEKITALLALDAEALYALGTDLPHNRARVLTEIKAFVPDRLGYTTANLRGVRITDERGDFNRDLWLTRGAITLGKLIILKANDYIAISNQSTPYTLYDLLGSAPDDSYYEDTNLLVHEMVHVKQYDRVGTDRYFSKYILENVPGLTPGYGFGESEQEAYIHEKLVAESIGGFYCQRVKPFVDNHLRQFAPHVPLVNCSSPARIIGQPEALGGVLKSPPECVSWGKNRLDCFVQGADDRLHHKWYGGSSWNGWESLDGQITGRPSCVTRGANRIDCFARGKDNALWQRQWDGTRWRPWARRSGVLTSSPECVSWDKDKIDCFVRGGDGALHHGWSYRDDWRGWEGLGGQIIGAPKCVSWGVDRIDCFARWTDNSLRHRWWDGESWKGWESLGGQMKLVPECVTWGVGRIDCFVRGRDDAMWHIWTEGRGWQPWESLGGVLTSAPNCETWRVGRIDCFARGTDDDIWHRWTSGWQWGGWLNVGTGTFRYAPTCLSWGGERLDCFVVDSSSRSMQHLWWSGLTWNGGPR